MIFHYRLSYFIKRDFFDKALVESKSGLSLRLLSPHLLHLRHKLLDARRLKLVRPVPVPFES